MKHLVKKNKNIVLGILFIAIIVCTPFLFGEEGCDGLNEVANSVDQNIQNNTSVSNQDGSVLGLTPDEINSSSYGQVSNRQEGDAGTSGSTISDNYNSFRITYTNIR